MIDISRRLTFLLIFLVLAILKLCGQNSMVDDAILLIIGALIGKEVLTNAQKKQETKAA